MHKRFKKIDIKKVLKYLIVGGSAFVIYYFFLWALFDFLNLNYSYAVTFSYLISSTFHFFANKKFTFKAKNEEYIRQLFFYIVVAIINYIIQLETIKILYGNFDLNLYISAFIGILLTILVGFTLLNNWVFKEG